MTPGSRESSETPACGTRETRAESRDRPRVSSWHRPRVFLAIRDSMRRGFRLEPSTDRARVESTRCHGCTVSRSDRATLRSSRDTLEQSPDLTFPLVSLDSTAVVCSAAKPAFVEKVEKFGKAAIAGLAASAVLASVR